MHKVIFNLWTDTFPDRMTDNLDMLEIDGPTCLTELSTGQPHCGRCSDLTVSALVSGSSGPGSSPGRGHCVVFLGKTLNSLSASPPRCINGYRQI